MGTGPLAKRGYSVARLDREPRIGRLVPDLTAPPTFSEAVEILEMGAAVACGLVEYRLDSTWPSGSIFGTVRPCECGEPTINDDACRLCRTLAQIHPVTARDPHDLECRYQAAERYLDRVAAVVAALKERLQAVPLGGVEDADR